MSAGPITAALVEAFAADEDGNPRDNGLDIIGIAYHDAQEDETPQLREGWFANWIGEALPASLESYRVEPVTPFRVFAGWGP